MKLVSRSILACTLMLGCGDGGDDAENAATSETTGAAATSGEASTAGADSSTGATDAMSTTGNGGSTSAAETTGGQAGEDLDMTPEDFACLLDWERVRQFRITNLLGYTKETLGVANSPDGGEYPVGTVIQLVPTEAMVKRAAGWSPETNDWEFFFLQVDMSGTTIVDRGTTDVVNAFGLNCLDCHSLAEPQWDFVCEDDHGCNPLPLTDELIDMLQDDDPRCGG